jgi:hypothetical protein
MLERRAAYKELSSCDNNYILSTNYFVYILPSISFRISVISLTNPFIKTYYTSINKIILFFIVSVFIEM